MEQFRRLIFFLSTSLFSVLLVQGAMPSRAITVSSFQKAPLIDGLLNDEVWSSASVIADFNQVQPGENARPSRRTEVRLGTDKKYLYLAIHAFDDPGQVRSTIAKRDDLSGNDYVVIWLDTFYDRQRAYVLEFNPLGIQADGIFSEGGVIDRSVDIVMQSKGVITNDGYTIEVTIPFSSLRCRSGKGTIWGMHVLRRINHLDEWDSWAPLRRETYDFDTERYSRFLEQAGQVSGIDEINAGRTLELIPTITFSETGKRVATVLPNATERFVNGPLHVDPGLTAKLALTSGLTLSAAINPDFAQVEADQLVVTANQRFPIFFEEKRPFFLEGTEIFQTPVKTVHTRAIVDPDWAVKLTGKRGKNSFGVMAASDNAPGNFSDEERNDPSIERFVEKNAFVGVARFKRDIGKESNIGAIATSYDFVDDHNRVFGTDGRWAVNTKTVLTFQVLGSTTRGYFYDPSEDKDIYRTGNGLVYYLRADRNTRHLNFMLVGRGYSPDYRANVGFVSQTNTNPWDLIATYNSTPRKDSKFISWSIASASRAQFDWKGRMQYSFESVRTRFNFKKQTYFKTDIYSDYQRVFEEEFGAKRTTEHTGAFLGQGERSTIYHGFTVEAGSAPSKKIEFSILFDETWRAFDFDLGGGRKFPRVSPAALANPDAPLDPGFGKTLDATVSMVLRPTDALTFSVDYVKSKLFRTDTRRLAFDQNIYSIETSYQFSRSIATRLRVDYDTLRSRVFGQFLASWTPNPGTALYVGYNDDLSYNGFSPVTQAYQPGLYINSRTFFLKMSYLFRKRL